MAEPTNAIGVEAFRFQEATDLGTWDTPYARLDTPTDDGAEAYLPLRQASSRTNDDKQTRLAG